MAAKSTELLLKQLDQAIEAGHFKDARGHKPRDPKAEPEAKPVAKPEAKPVAKPEAKPEAKPVAKPEPKPVAKPEPEPTRATKVPDFHEFVRTLSSNRASSVDQRINQALNERFKKKAR